LSTQQEKQLRAESLNKHLEQAKVLEKEFEIISDKVKEKIKEL